MIAEPLALVREGFAALCESSGPYEVVFQCADGEAAVEAVVSRNPDLALLDLDLPRLFVLQVIHRIRTSEASTRIVVLGRRKDRKTVVEVLRSGASAYVLKSGPAEHLVQAFRQVSEGGVYVSPQLDLERILLPQKRSGPDDPMEALSPREYQVFTLIVEGIRAKEIAARLNLSPKTVDTYRASLMRKLDIHDIAGLVKFAIRRNLTATA